MNPRLGLARAKDELRRRIDVYGARGVKPNGARDTYYVDAPHLSSPLVATAAQAGPAVASHCGANGFEKMHP